MKKKFIQILAIIFQKIDVLLCKLHLHSPKIVIYMDGGICSQMLMYLHGQYYAEYGFEVLYDDYWYQKNGKNKLSYLIRTFELTEMWPNLKFKVISKWQRKWYLMLFQIKRKESNLLPVPDTVIHSIYLNGYWDIPEKEHNRLFRQLFKLADASAPDKFHKFDSKSVVGVHVRRGDLARGDNPYYGGVTDGYFMRAIDFCNQYFTPQMYIFFSDEPDWVENNICNQLEQPYKIMRDNKAWEDLWLLAQCPIIIASQGSFGKVAARLSPDAFLIQCDNKYAWRERENTFYIQ